MDFMASGPEPETTTQVDLSFLGTRTLPAWLTQLPLLTALNLTGCDALEDISAIRSLTRLRRLRLTGCRALVHLDDAQLGVVEVHERATAREAQPAQPREGADGADVFERVAAGEVESSQQRQLSEPSRERARA